MNKISELFLIITLALTTTSCSVKFHRNPELNQKLASVEIVTEGDSIYIYDFKNRLKQLLNNSHTSKVNYILKLHFVESSKGMILGKDSDTVRKNIDLIVHYSLHNKNDEREILKSKFRIMNSFNTMYSPYSTDIEQNYAISKSYVAAAEQIRKRLILFFLKNSPAN